MSNDQIHTTDETEPTRATRRTVLRGAGVAGLLTMGVGTASAQKGKSTIKAKAKAKGPVLPPKAAQKAKDIIDIKFPKGGGGDNDGGGGNGGGIGG